MDNLYNTKNNWTWKEIEEAFIEQNLPIGHLTFLRTTLENKRQGKSETETHFMTEIQSLCGQIDNKMKEENVCIYVLKGLKENILQTISMQDNTTLKKLKENLNKFELMQHRISNWGAITSEYTDILNLQVIKLQKYHDDKESEEKKKLQEENEGYKRRVDQISEEVRRLNILGRQSNKTVEFEGSTTKNDIEHITQIERQEGEIMIEIEIMSRGKNIGIKVRSQEGHVNKVRIKRLQ